MKLKIAIVALVIVLGTGVWFAFRSADSKPVQLAPAWQLTVKNGCDAAQYTDPFAAWSPDSRSLLFSVCNMQAGYKYIIYRWKVGEKKLERVTEGNTPNYLDNDNFLFLRQNPRIVMQYSFGAHKEREIMPEIKKSDFWKECMGLVYDPKRKTVKVGFGKLSRFYEPGCQEFDMSGKLLGNVSRATGDGVLAASSDPKGAMTASILGEMASPNRLLKVSRGTDKASGTTMGNGDFGDVAWSPDGRIIAYGEQADVNVMRPNDLKPITVAKLGVSNGGQRDPFVCRLLWSPDSSYLAALVMYPNEDNTYQMIYVLDMTKLKL